MILDISMDETPAEPKPKAMAAAAAFSSPGNTAQEESKSAISKGMMVSMGAGTVGMVVAGPVGALVGAAIGAGASLVVEQMNSHHATSTTQTRKR